MLPTISCLCPTYGRPRLLMNAVACFLAQDYPHNRRHLVIVDDLGTINPYIPPLPHSTYSGVVETIGSLYKEIEVHSTQMRFPSLPEKYNAAWRIAPPSDIYVVWEDDDAQLPWCLSSHAKALEHRPWSQPSEVWSDYAGQLHTEPTGGRFHGSLAFRGSALDQIGGWPLTRRADFDQQFMSLLRQTFGVPGDPLIHSPEKPDALQPNPAPHDCCRDIDCNVCTDFWIKNHSTSSPYVFRWAHGYHHGQSEMRSPDDETWYDRYRPPDYSGPHSIIPQMDDQTREFYRVLAGDQGRVGSP